MAVTIHEVARRARVTGMTVSRVVNRHASVRPATRARVEAAMRALNYVPNALAQGLKGRATRTLGLVVGDVSNPFFTLVARGVEDVATAAGYSVILCNSDDDSEKERVYLDVLARKRIDGLVLTPADGPPARVLDWARRIGPVCLIDRPIPGLDFRRAGIDIVRGENLKASEDLMAHLIAHGHRRIGIVNGPAGFSTAAERLKGYRRALRAAGIATDQALERNGRFTVESGRTMTDELLAQHPRPTAVFATNNLLAVGAMTAAQARGLRVPGDLALVTFDDIPHLSAVWPFVTVAAQAAILMGERAARFVLDRIEGGRSTAARRLPGRDLVLPTRLRLRRSCGCAASRARGALHDDDLEIGNRPAAEDSHEESLR